MKTYTTSTGDVNYKNKSMTKCSTWKDSRFCIRSNDYYAAGDKCSCFLASKPQPKKRIKKEKSSEVKVMGEVMKAIEDIFEYKKPVKGSLGFIAGYNEALKVVAYRLVEIEFGMLDSKQEG